jgi:membrane protein involved in colicin uptake
MMAFIQAFPPAAPILAPKVAKDMDWEGADEVGEELEALLPPPVQAILQQRRAQKEGQPEIPAEAQAQMQQLQQQLQEMQQQMQQLQQQNQELQSGAAVQREKIAADQAMAQQKQADAQQAKLADAQAREAEAQAAAAEAVRIAEINANAQAQAKIRAAQIAADADVRIAEIKAMAQPMPMESAPMEAMEPTAKPDGLLELANAVAQMAQALSRPKTLVRGPDGRAIGVQ